MATPYLFLFVSHVSEDRSAAYEIVAELERRGVSCWIAPRDVRPGRPFDDEIVEAIETCRAMLLIFSGRCNESEYIRREVTVAGDAGKVIVPFRIEDAKPQRALRVRLSDLHWIDAFASRESAVEEVVKTFQPIEPADPPIRQAASTTDASQPTRPEPTRPEITQAAAKPAVGLVIDPAPSLSRDAWQSETCLFCWALGAMASVAGVMAMWAGIPIREFSWGSTLIFAGSIALTGGLIEIGLATAEPIVFGVLGFATSACGIAAIGYGISIGEFAVGATLILAGTVALTGGLIQVGLAFTRPLVSAGLGIALAVGGLTAIGFGIPVHEFSLGGAFIVAGAIALAGGLSVIGPIVAGSWIVWALGLGASAAGVVALGFGIPISEFSLGGILIVTGAVMVAGGLVDIGLAVTSALLLWVLGLAATFVGLGMVGFGASMHELSLGATLIHAGMMVLVGGLVLVHLAAVKGGGRPHSRWTWRG
jgi:hypothetical protein